MKESKNDSDDNPVGEDVGALVTFRGGFVGGGVDVTLTPPATSPSGT